MAFCNNLLALMHLNKMEWLKEKVVNYSRLLVLCCCMPIISLNFGLTLSLLVVILLVACHLQSCRIKFLILFCFPNSHYILFHFVPFVVFVLNIVLIQDKIPKALKCLFWVTLAFRKGTNATHLT